MDSKLAEARTTRDVCPFNVALDGGEYVKWNVLCRLIIQQHSLASPLMARNGVFVEYLYLDELIIQKTLFTHPHIDSQPVRSVHRAAYFNGGVPVTTFVSFSGSF